MNIILWIFLGFILLVLTAGILLKGISQKIIETSHKTVEPSEELNKRITSLEKRVEDLENNRT